MISVLFLVSCSTGKRQRPGENSGVADGGRARERICAPEFLEAEFFQGHIIADPLFPPKDPINVILSGRRRSCRPVLQYPSST